MSAFTDIYKYRTHLQVAKDAFPVAPSIVVSALHRQILHFLLKRFVHVNLKQPKNIQLIYRPFVNYWYARIWKAYHILVDIFLINWTAWLHSRNKIYFSVTRES